MAKKNRTRKGREIPLWRKAVLSLIVATLFFAGLELILAAAGVKQEAYVDDPYVGFSSLSPLFVPAGDSSGDVVTAQNKLRLFNMQRFAADKPSGVTRVFCVGGSTTFGRPYDDETSFCGWLRELLPVADPSREWELINAGGISYASYRVAVLMEELAQYEPDYFIIYSGHNEFLEQRTYEKIISMPPAVRGLASIVAKSRIHTVVKSVMDAAGGDDDGESTENTLDSEVTTLLDQAVGPSAYSRDDQQRERIIEHYRFNLARMVDIARSAGAVPVLVKPASNLRDCLPFKSEHRSGMSQDQLDRWEAHVAGLAKAIAEENAAAARAELAAALALDDRFARLHFQDARVKEALQLYEEARAAYERARDEDICPLRALGVMEEAVVEVAADRDVALVDYSSAVDAASPHRLPGATVFLDHVHPTVRGNLLLARTIVEAMADAELLRLGGEWSEDSIARIAAEVEAGLDTATHAQALTKLSKVLAWAGKLEEAYRLAQQAVRLDPNNLRVQYQAGLVADLLGKVDESIVHYTRATEIKPDADLPHGNLGVALEKKGRLEEAIQHFRIAVSLGAGDDQRRNAANLANALHHLGAKKLAAGEFKSAVTLLTEAHDMTPGNPDLAMRLGIAAFGAGDFEVAVKALDAATQLMPNNASAHNRRAIALYFAGRYEESLVAYRRALSLDQAIRERPESLENYLRKFGRAAEADAIAQDLMNID